MSGETSFLVEEFINAITSQLDRVQDALRLKALNRPLTYALRDLTLELKVFVEMDAQGNVRFRNSSPNEAGASTVNLGFTTITKPMIDENTISLAATRSVPLEELGLSPEERQRLERYGVRNLAQLHRLQSTTGVQTVSRLSAISVERLKGALVLGQPRVTRVQPEPPAASHPTPAQPAPPPAQFTPPVRTPGPGTHTPVRPVAPAQPGLPVAPPLKGPAIREGMRPVIGIQPGTRRLQLSGQNLLGEEGTPEVRLNQQPLAVAHAEDDQMIVELPTEVESGALEVSLPGGQIAAFELSVQRGGDSDEAHDTWAPDDTGAGDGR